MWSEPVVLIAGAGPTGLTLACGLLANGVAAWVVDKAVGPAGTSRALGLQPRGIEVLVANRLGDHAMTALVASQDTNQDILLVRPDAHLGWRGRPDPDTLDQWLTTRTQHGQTT
jgi:hypothetical protein